MPALRLMTYNIRRCTMGRGRGVVDRVAAVIERVGAEVVALQEVDVGHHRTGFVDQAGALAARLGMGAHFQPAIAGPGGAEYGNALLSRHPFRVVRSALLPLAPGIPAREPRGASWSAVRAGGAELHVFVTHLGLSRRERHAQLDLLLGEQWLAHPDCRPPLLLMGDLNFVPGSAEHRRLLARLRDALHLAPPPGRRATFPSFLPLVRLDHVLVSAGVHVRHTAIVRGPELRWVSDHLPLVVEIELPVEALGEAHARAAAAAGSSAGRAARSRPAPAASP